tara:strand:+ start:210 stop:710 length:501 start_codon:yes stop_codon:yes gene_type:complete
MSDDDDDWDVHDITIDPKKIKWPVRNIFKPKTKIVKATQPALVYEPFFFCKIGDKFPYQIVLAAPPTPLSTMEVFKIVKIDDELYLLVLYDGQKKCRWKLKREANDKVVALSYEWFVDDERYIDQKFKNEFTKNIEDGYNSEYYGKDIFGKKWAIRGSEYKQFTKD